MPERKLKGILQFNPKTLFFEEIGLYLDGHYGKPLAFVSHAHADHFAPHDMIICSKATGYLLEKRFRVSPASIISLDWDTPYDIDDHTIRLFPAGHIAGSAMILITKDGESLLYTGDFKTRESLTSESPVFPKADILIMESTFGLPHYVFPSAEKINQELVEFAEAALADDCAPIILGYSLGKAQEAHAILAEAGIPVVLHRSVYDMAMAFNTLGIYPLPEPVRIEKKIPAGHAFIAPPNMIRSRALRTIKNKRSVMLSGWALNPSAIYRYQTDEVIALSDHADFPGLLEAVERVDPALIYTLHGSTKEFAAELRARGREAWSVYGDDQLELITNKSITNNDSSAQDLARPECQIKELSELLLQLQKTASRLKKIELLAVFIKSLSEGDLRIVLNWLRETRINRLGPNIIKQSILRAAGQPLARYKTISAQQSDSARTGRIMLELAKLDPEPYSFEDIYDEFTQINLTSVQLEKVRLFTLLLKRSHPREGETIIRIASGGMRAGVKDGLLEDAIANAYEVKPTTLRRAHMLSGDLAHTAVLAKNNQLATARLEVGTAIKPMLASPATDVEKILDWNKKLETDAQLWVEEKYDGIRAQLHVSEDEVHLYSRDLKTLDDQFPELIAAAKVLPPCIIDGEIIAFIPGDDSGAKKLTFNDIQKRLGRKSLSLAQGDLFGGPSVPVSLVAFDCIWSGKWAAENDEGNLFEQSLTERRIELERLKLEYPFQCIGLERIDAEDPDRLQAAFKSALKDDNEGLMLKDERAPYQPGRRGRAWMKLKGVMPTLDCVVIAAQQGHGKRAGLLSDYTFAIKDDETGDLVTLGKAYSGLTDEEIEELTIHFQRTTLGKPQRKVHEVQPTIILEIAFDRISPSKRHNSGLALRFPRIKAIRRDKTLDEIDSLATALSLVKKK